jgi:hypothetical protein
LQRFERWLKFLPMTSASLTAGLRVPGFATRVSAIMTGLLALIVRLLFRDPRRLALGIAAWHYINRTLRDLEILLDRLAAGEPAPPPRPSRRTAARPPIPRASAPAGPRHPATARRAAPATNPPAAAPESAAPPRPWRNRRQPSPVGRPRRRRPNRPTTFYPSRAPPLPNVILAQSVDG